MGEGVVAVVLSLRVPALALLLLAPGLLQPAQSDTPSANGLASITIDVQTFGRAKADFPATIQVHSPVLESDLSATSDKPSKVDFPNLPPGMYRVSVTAPSRDAAQLDVPLSPGQKVRLSLIVDRVFPLTLNLDSATLGLSGSLVGPASAVGPSSGGVAVAPATPSSPGSAAATEADSDVSHAAMRASSADIPGPAAAAEPATAQPFVGTCSADEVIPHISAHVQQFVDSINRITATESMEFERRNRKGKFEEDAKAKVSYVAVIQPQENGFLSVEEYRNGTAGMTSFPGHISATGSVALVLIFHPVHLNEFRMDCKGLTYWHNTPVYEIAFEQRSDVPNTMSEFRAAHMSYDILLKGTAFVDRDSFQILHIDTDLARPIPDVLDLEHQSVDYGSVTFTSHADQLWLPRFVMINVRYRNKEFLEQHSYVDYRLFSVDTGQKISKPVVPADPNAPSPN